jgi:predicted dehydrogenase
VAHVARAPIVRARATVTSGNGECLVRIEAGFDGALSATSTVGHAARYEEHLSVGTQGRVHRADASGGSLRQAGLALRKLTGRPTPAGESFRAQLAGFVSAFRGVPDGIGAGAADGLASVEAVEACLRSVAQGGAWCDVPDYANA